MKVAFKLNQDQLFRAERYITDRWCGGWAEGCVWAGNIGGWMQNHPAFNPAQDLSLQGGILTYRGQRCPFLRDGLYELTLEILGDGPVEVAEYVTSDARLRWDENLHSFLWDRADWETYRSHNKGKTSDIPERFSDQSRISFLLKTGREKAAYAEFPGGLVREVSSFIRACE